MVRSEGVRFKGMDIQGIGRQNLVVEVNNGCLGMEGCHVSGGFNRDGGGAVRVSGSSARLTAGHTILHSGGCGLVVNYGKANLRHCTVSNNGCVGVFVMRHGSKIEAIHTHIDNNQVPNIVVAEGDALLRHVTCNGSRQGSGIGVKGFPGSIVTVLHSEARGNRVNGANAVLGASLELVHSHCTDNGGCGWCVRGSDSSIRAESSVAKGNKRGSIIEENGGRVICCGDPPCVID